MNKRILLVLIVVFLNNNLHAETYYKIKNKWSKEYIQVSTDTITGNQLGSLVLKKGILNKDLSAQWSIEQTRNGYFKLKNRLTKQYMHSDHKPSYVGLAKRVWKNSEWIKEPSKFSGYYRLRSRYTEQYMHIEDRLGHIQLKTNVPGNWWSPLWMLEKVQ